LPSKFAEASKALEAVQRELAKAEDQLVELEMVREALEAGRVWAPARVYDRRLGELGEAKALKHK
jgi:hypothetical protein